MEEVHPHRVALGNSAFLSPMEPKNKYKVYLDLGERDQWEVPGGLQLVTRTARKPEKCPNFSD
jgi:hypothetical protein